MLIRTIFFRVMFATLLMPVAQIVPGADIEEFEIGEDANALVRPSAIVLYNDSRQDITFFLSSDTLTNRKHVLTDSQRREFSDGQSSQYVIELPTAEKGAMKYILRAQSRYEIYWNENAARWDIVERITR